MTTNIKLEFSQDPTSRGDEVAEYVRDWYEANRETWWERRGKKWEYCADNFMLGLVNEVERILAAAEESKHD
jgi:hypothetical protein